MSNRCERCGKFRKDRDVAYNSHGDGYDECDVMECRWCMSPIDAERLPKGENE